MALSGRVLFFIFTFFLFLSAQAEVELHGYPTYAYTIDDSDDGNIKLYFGNTSNACATTSTSSTCDSCATLSAIGTSGPAVSAVCNSSQIHPALLFSVTISSDSEDLFDGSPDVIMTVGGVSVNATSVSGTIAKDSEVTASFAWSDICNAATSGDTGCETSFKETVLVGFDEDGDGDPDESAKFTVHMRYVSTSDPMNLGCATGTMNSWEGFCDYFVYPGDEKIFVDAGVNTSSDYKVGNLMTTGTATAADPSGMTFGALRVYYAEGTSFTSITPASGYADLPFSDGKLSTDKVTGLRNDQPYVFIIASVDQGGNVTHFVPESAASSPSCPSTEGSSVICNDSSPTYYNNAQAATPREVFGLFDKNKCFIATATYGSPFSPQVQMLRKFRDQYLTKSSFGLAFIRTYYKYSPSVARLIESSKTLKIIAQIILSPVFVFLILVNSLGMPLAIIIGLVGSAGITIFIHNRLLPIGRREYE